MINRCFVSTTVIAYVKLSSMVFIDKKKKSIYPEYHIYCSYVFLHTHICICFVFITSIMTVYCFVFGWNIKQTLLFINFAILIAGV